MERDGIVGQELELQLGRSAGPGCCTPLQKQVTKGDRRGFARCLSDAKVSSSLMKEKINCLEGECSAYLSPMGWPDIYSICFSQLDSGKDSFPLDEVFSAFIAIRLIRDNEGVVIENYPSSLIGEIQFDLQDKLLLGIILLPLLVRFSLSILLTLGGKRTWLIF